MEIKIENFKQPLENQGVVYKNITKFLVFG